MGDAARQARKALELTQEDAAERIGISLEFYARIERGGTLPSVPTLARMVEALEVSADFLLGRAGRAGLSRERSARWKGKRAPAERPDLRRLLRRLRRAQPRTLRLLNSFMTALERR